MQAWPWFCNSHRISLASLSQTVGSARIRSSVGLFRQGNWPGCMQAAELLPSVTLLAMLTDPYDTATKQCAQGQYHSL